MLSKKGIQDFFIKCSWDFIKDIIKPYILPALSSIGGYMLTQNIIAWLLIFSGSSGMIYMLRKFIINLKKDIINDIFNIEDKLMIFTNYLYQTIVNEKKCSLSIILQIYNCSNQIMSCIIDEEKTKLIIDGKTKHKFQYNKIDELLPPYHLSNLSTDSIELDLEEKNIFEKIIQIDAEVHLVYGLKGNEKHITSRKITNFVKLVRHGDYHIIAIQVQPKNSTKPLASPID